MKRIFVGMTLLVAVLGNSRLGAQQDSPTAVAEREEAELRHRSILKKLEGLEESVAACQKNTTALREEIRHLKDDFDRLKAKNEAATTQDSLKRFAEKIEEVDKKRQADNERTVKYIDARNAELQKLILEKPSVAPRGPVSTGSTPGVERERERPRQPVAPPAGAPERGFEYKIKSGDRLPKIVVALKAQGFKATEKQLMDANPTVDWSKLKIDQKIFIPDSR